MKEAEKNKEMLDAQPMNFGQLLLMTKHSANKALARGDVTAFVLQVKTLDSYLESFKDERYNEDIKNQDEKYKSELKRIQGEQFAAQQDLSTSRGQMRLMTLNSDIMKMEANHAIKMMGILSKLEARHGLLMNIDISIMDVIEE